MCVCIILINSDVLTFSLWVDKHGNLSCAQVKITRVNAMHIFEVSEGFSVLAPSLSMVYPLPH